MRFHERLVYSFIPGSVEIQLNSFSSLLKEGLITELSFIKGFKNSTLDLELNFYPEYYKLDRPEYTQTKAILQGKTYSCKLYVPVELIDHRINKRKFQWVLLGDLPLMTKRGHFIINGSPRVVVNQLVRSPGIYFQEVITFNKEGDPLVRSFADLIAYRGTWLRLVIDPRGFSWARIKKAAKVDLFVFLFSFVYLSKKKTKRLPPPVAETIVNILKQVEKDDIYKRQKDDILKNQSKSFRKMFQNIPKNQDDVFRKLYRESQSIFPKTFTRAQIVSKKRSLLLNSTPLQGKMFLWQKFGNARTYHLSEMGRQRLNIQLCHRVSIVNNRLLESKDILYAVENLLSLREQKKSVDDIDDLKNRRVKASGELIQNQLNTGITRLEKLIYEEFKKLKVLKKSVLLQKLITTKPINGALREFFASSPLSQYMDQTNPLAEITHKRRLSCLGAGGITRETAGMSIRSIHPTYYGRICPIETPEGRNAGLVNSLTTHGKVDSYGLLRTPFYSVFVGQIQKLDSSLHYGRPIFFTTEEEDLYKIASPDIKNSLLNFLPKSKIPIRIERDYYQVPREDVEFIGMSHTQMISIATSLIPFLEHDDANRALMGSNMQRQAVPVLFPERPIVGTGLEGRAAGESGHVLDSKTGGYVCYASGKKVVIISKPKSFSQKTFNFSLFSFFKTLKTGFRMLGKENRRDRGVKSGYLLEGVTPKTETPVSSFLNKQKSEKVRTLLGLPPFVPFTDHIPFTRDKRDTRDTRDTKDTRNTTRLTPLYALFLTEPDGPRFVPSFHRLLNMKYMNQDESYPCTPVMGYGAWGKELSFQSGGKAKMVLQFFPHSGFLYKEQGDILFPKKTIKISGNKALLPDEFVKKSNSVENTYKGYSVSFMYQSLKKKFFTLFSSCYSKYSLRKNTKTNLKVFGTKVRDTKSNLRIKGIEHSVQNYQRSNQETCLAQRPTVVEREWVQKGDLLADCTSSASGDLSVGKNILVAYMPWEGYNFEDAILISERLVFDDIYTSIHIERYEVEIRDTLCGIEEICAPTPKSPDFYLAKRLNSDGIAKVGLSVSGRDILVRKLTPIKQRILSPHEKLFYDIIGKKVNNTRDTSLYLPKGVRGKVIHFEILETENIPPGIPFKGPGRVHVYIAERRKIRVGDKISGRHGNKGIVSRILVRQDMPYLPNGTPVDMVLNPLGVPSRMNVGQVFEALLGLAGFYLNQSFKIPSFDERYGTQASRSVIYSKLYQASLKTGQKWLFDPSFPGKTKVFDGRTGQCFDQDVTVGQAYMLKLVHLVDDKIHARSTGPYSLVTQQPLKGRAKHGGQRLGEMEVWAFEGFGAAYTLQEVLTFKSDDIKNRGKVFDKIINDYPKPFTAERVSEAFEIYKKRRGIFDKIINDSPKPFTTKRVSKAFEKEKKIKKHLSWRDFAVNLKKKENEDKRICAGFPATFNILINELFSLCLNVELFTLPSKDKKKKKK